MPHATLSVRLPGRAWIGEISRAYPDATFRVLAALPTEDTGVGLVEIDGVTDSAIVEAIEAHSSVVSLEVLGHTGERLVVQFETAAPLLLFSVQESGVPLEPPIEIREGRATVEVAAAHERLSELGEQLEQFGLSFDVQEVRHTVPSTEQLLTDRQRELLTTAATEGYYDTPRRCSLTDLAEHLDVAKSTVSETLHRAEETIVKEFVEDIDDGAIAEAQPPTAD